MDLKFLEESFKKGGSIHIKKKNRGKFTDYCGGEVTLSCINKAKASGNSTLKKRAIFAENARKWKHLNGGVILNPFNYFLDIHKVDTRKFLEGGNIYAEYKALETNKDENPYEWASKNPFDYTYRINTPYFKNTSEESLEDENDTEEKPFELTYKDYDVTSKEKPKIDVKSGNSNQLTAFNYFIEKGLTPEQASGFVGNFMAESYDDLKTDAINLDEKKAGITNYGRGVALWSNERVDDFTKKMGVRPEDATLQQLLDFTWYEMQKRPALMAALKKVKSAEEAADVVYRGFENGTPSALATPDLLRNIYGTSWKNLGLREYNYENEKALRAAKARRALQSLQV